MVGKIRNYLNLTLPKLLTFRRGWVYLLIISISNIVMVYFLHPFGKSDPLLPQQPYLLTGFGWACALMYILLYQLLPVAMKWVYKMGNWTLALEFHTFGIYFLTMLLINWLYASLVIPSHETGWTYFISILCFTVLYQLLPVAFCTLLHLTIHSFKIQLAAKESEKPATPESSPDKVLDMTEHHAGMYPLTDIRLLIVVGNYTRIHYMSKGHLKHDTVHLSLKKVFSKLDAYPEFVYCRISCVVNLDCVTVHRSNSREMKLSFTDCTAQVNVARDKIPHIKQLLKEKGIAT